MKTVTKLIDEIPKRDRTHWTVLDEGRIEVSMRGGARGQKVSVSREGDTYVFSSVVLGSQLVTQSDRFWRDLARMAWERNAAQQMVGFGFDDRDRMVGRVEHPAAFLDTRELWEYVEALAWECDRMEEMILGEDLE